MALSYGKKDKPSFEKKEDSGLVSMELDDEDKMDTAIMVSGKELQPDFPYGLRISLTENELKALSLDAKDAELGSYLTFKARACVKSKSEHEDDSGKCCRLELQIEGMKIVGAEE